MQPDQSLSFERDALAWPNREASRFVNAAGIDWHVQDIGRQDTGKQDTGKQDTGKQDTDERPILLLIHGTGAATHSWRGLVALLKSHFRIVAVDLPGHGFTQKPPATLLSLPGMANGLCQLLQRLEIQPDLVAGHSAGAAVMIRMALDCRIAPEGLVAINGALTPYGGEANRWLAPLAKLLFLNPIMPRFFAWQAGNKAAVQRLIRNTGSTIDAEGIDQYRLLVSNPGHVAAALGMMANWDLQPLSRDMGLLDVPLLLIAGSADKAIKSEDAFKVRAKARNAKVEILRGLGHLAHEERPEAVADLVLAFATELGVASR